MKKNENFAEKFAEGFKQSLDLLLTVKNITSNRDIPCRKEFPITISEFIDKGLILNLPPLTCAQGHQLLLDINLSKEKHEILHFSTTAKIIALEANEHGFNRVSLKFVQYDPLIWKKFLRVFQTCQDELQELLESLKSEKK